jgi:hypothetical protein
MSVVPMGLPFSSRAIIRSGKYAGRTVAEVVVLDPPYARWMAWAWRTEPVRSAVRAALAALNASTADSLVPKLVIELPLEGRLRVSTTPMTLSEFARMTDWLRQQDDEILEVLEAAFNAEQRRAA